MKKLFIFMLFVIPRFLYAIQIYVGSYVGNGTDDHEITGVGFMPDVVITIGSTALTDGWCWKTSVMGGDSSLLLGTDAAAILTGIKTFTSDGFKLGSADYANADGTFYPFIAFKDNGDGYMCLGRYTGNGVDDRNITITNPTLAYSLVIVQSMTYGSRALWKTTIAGGDTCFGFVQTGGNLFPNYIQSTGVGTFQVGTAASVNANTHKYVYFCIANIPNLFEIARYKGNGSSYTVTMGWDIDFTLCQSIGLFSSYCGARIDGTLGSECSETRWAKYPPKGYCCDAIDMVDNGVEYIYETNLHLNTNNAHYWCWMVNAGSYMYTTRKNIIVIN